MQQKLTQPCQSTIFHKKLILKNIITQNVNDKLEKKKILPTHIRNKGLMSLVERALKLRLKKNKQTQTSLGKQAKNTNRTHK